MIYIGIKEKHKGGIYKITNILNNKVYIGRTKNFIRRYSQYLYDFQHRRIRTINNYLMSSMEKYGFENFTFEPILICSIQDSLIFELEYMKNYNSLNRDYGYNLRSDSDGGMITSKETSSKISSRLKKEWKDGKRNNHSKKLKKSWNNRNRKDQSELMTKNLTKYYYIINNDILNKLTYADLKALNLQNVIGSFHRKKSDDVFYKNIRIQRYLTLIGI